MEEAGAVGTTRQEANDLGDSVSNDPNLSQHGAIWQRRTEKVSDVIAREIVHDIVRRGLAPGTMLPPEHEMLETYEVGRASLREALRILEVHGLIAIKPGRGGGPIVSAVTDHDFARMSTLYFHVANATYRDLMEARMMIEPMMAAVIATRGGNAVREALERALGSTREALTEQHSARYLASTTEFHSVILGVSGNPILDVFGEALKKIFAERIVSGVFPPEYRSEIAAQHQGIADAIIRGDPEGAEKAMRSHMEQYARHLFERFPGLLDEVIDWR